MNEMPLYLKYFRIFMNTFMTWPTRKSNEEKLKKIEDKLAKERAPEARDGDHNLTATGFCCALFWPEIYNKPDEYHDVSSEKACQDLVADNQYSDYRKNLPAGPCAR